MKNEQSAEDTALRNVKVSERGLGKESRPQVEEEPWEKEAGRPSEDTASRVRGKAKCAKGHRWASRVRMKRRRLASIGMSKETSARGGRGDKMWLLQEVGNRGKQGAHLFTRRG